MKKPTTYDARDAYARMAEDGMSGRVYLFPRDDDDEDGTDDTESDAS